MKFKTLITVCFLLAGFSVFAQNQYSPVSNTQQLHSRINESAKSINTIKSHFTQKKHMDFMEADITTKGRFYFKASDKLRWEYTHPFNYLVVLNNGKITIEDNGKKNVFDASASQSFENLNDLLLGAIRGTLLSNSSYSNKSFESKNHYLIKLYPKDKELAKTVKELQLYLNKKSLEVERVKMMESSNDYTLITFTEKILNAPISNNLFTVN